MAKIRRCPTCQVVFRTIDALNDHYKRTSHIPYKCELCERGFKRLPSLLLVGIQLSVLIDLSISWEHMKHILSKHPQLQSYNCNSCNRVLNFKTISSLVNVRSVFFFKKKAYCLILSWQLVFTCTGHTHIKHFQLEHPDDFTLLYCEPCKRLYDTSTGFQKVSIQLSDNCNLCIYLSTLIKHIDSHRRKAISSTPASSVIGQMDPSDLHSRRDGDWDTNTNGCGSPNDVKDCDAQRDPTLAESVGVLTLFPRSSTQNCYIQHPSALLSGNISKPLSVSEFTSPCTLFPLT